MGTEQERDEAIAVLERRLQRRAPAGVSAPVAASALVLALLAIWLFERKDLAYFASSPEPLLLGREGEYRWELLESNRYARIHGAPTTRGLYAPESGGVMVVVGLRDTPVLVQRRALPREDWSPGKGTPPQPDQRPFGVEGRLLAVEDAPAWARDAADQLRKSDEVRPVEGRMWIVLSGDRPRSNRSLVLVTALLLTFAALNAYFVVRDLQHRLRR